MIKGACGNHSIEDLILALLEWLPKQTDGEHVDYFFVKPDGKNACILCYSFFVNTPEGLWAALTRCQWSLASRLLGDFAKANNIYKKHYLNGVEI